MSLTLFSARASGNRMPCGARTAATRTALLLLALCAGLTEVRGQQRPRISGPVDETSLVAIPRSVHPQIQGAHDTGRVAPDLPLERMQLILDGTADQQAALNQLIAEQHDPTSPRYHQWLTPQQFGEQFGPSQAEIDAVAAWLNGHGLRVTSVANGRRVLEFSGTARQVEEAFHTEMHTYDLNGQPHLGNATEISLPTSIATVVRGVASLHDFRRRPHVHVVGTRSAAQAASRAAAVRSGTNQPLDTRPQNTDAYGDHYVTPYDFATIYNVLPVWSSLNLDGTGQSIALPSRVNINLSDVSSFRSKYGLPGNNTQIIVNGPDPGIQSGSDDESEAILDTEWSGAVAKGATIKLIVTQSTGVSDGIDLSDQYAVDQNIAPIVSVSYGNCETENGSGNAFYYNLWQQAVAQGISVFVASGDAGSADCDDPSSTSPAHLGLSVDGLASTPFDVAVGGTQFNETGSLSTYWSSTNDPTTMASARGYIPEVTWNESSYTSRRSSTNGLWSTGGGVSSLYATPSWQTGNGVPSADPGTNNQHHRYVPDVSFSAADHDGYLVVWDGQDYVFSGTSVATPSFAGIVAMINQYTGSRTGNPNPRLYAVASAAPQAFHDITSGNNQVPCVIGSSGCVPNPASTVGMMSGYVSGAGYDPTTGLGSVDAYNLITNWNSPTPPPTGSSLAGAQLVAGGGWQSTITLLNPTTATAHARLTFYDDSGALIALALVSADGSINTTATVLNVTLPPLTTQVVTTTRPSNLATQQGWVSLSADAAVTGYTVFRLLSSGQEVLVPLAAGSSSASYTLPYDNTNGLATGLALTNAANSAANIPVTVRDNNGTVLVSSSVSLPALGHTSFVLSDRFAAALNQYGTIEFDTPSGGQIGVLGIRADASGAFTGIPVLAALSAAGGSMAQLVFEGGWQSVIAVENPSSSSVQAHLRFYGDSGGAISVPVVSADGTINTTASAIDPVIGPQATLLLNTGGPASPPSQQGWVSLTSSGSATGFIVYRYNPTGQEVVAPAESTTASRLVLAYDNTNGLTTAIAIANASIQAAFIPVIVRDHTGTLVGGGNIALNANGHTSFTLTSKYPSAGGTYGSIEFDVPANGQISVVGIRSTAAGAFTSIPVLAP